MTNISVLLVIAAYTLQCVFADTDDACWINRCQCSRNSKAPYNDVKCFINSITPSDDTIQALPVGVQSLILSCSSPGGFSFFTAGIFEKFPNLMSLIVEQCNIITLTAESFRGLTSLTNLSIYESALPVLSQDTFKYMASLQHLSIVFCNMTIFPDISHLTSLQHLNISHNNLSHIDVASKIASEDGTNLSEGDSAGSSETNDLPDLRIIDLSFNNISSTPVGLLERTPHIRELYLTGLSLNQLLLPQKISLEDLVILDATQNLLQDVDFQSLGMARNMKNLRLEGTGFPLSCDGLSSLINLEELALNNFSITDSLWQELNSTLLVSLSLIKNSLTRVYIGSLPNLRILQLAKNGITFLSNLTLINQPDLLLANFSDNKIQTLPTDLFHSNLHLKVLDLSGNHLERLEYDTFKGLNELFSLDLSNNLLSDLPSTIFKDLLSMRFLYLSGNRLKYLPKLSYMTGLYALEVSNNKLSQLLPHELAGLDKLESFILNDNELTILPPNLFSQCPGLLQVYLDNNKITDLGSLGPHPNLGILTLGNNQLTDFVAESPFIYLRNLQFLTLGSNNFTSLKQNTFPSSIVTLFLDQNSIKKMEPGVFLGLDRLSYVSLTSNTVTLSIPPDIVNVFQMLSPKPTFNVAGNVFFCDCILSYIKEISENEGSVLFYKGLYPNFVGLDNALCYTPFWGDTFRPFTKVPISQFVCRYNDTWCDVFCNCCGMYTSCDCLVTCPIECKCLYGGSAFTKQCINIQCNSLNLSHVPDGIPSRTLWLYLDGNKLNHLSKENFTYLQKVEEIYLNNSAVQSIDTGTFDDIPTLMILMLNDNLLTIIPENLFGNMTAIKELYLHNNLISSISPVAFSFLSSMERITLHNNKLVLMTSVPQLPRQLSLTLSGNPWSCDCNVSKVIIRAVYELSQVIKDADKICCIVYNESPQSVSDADAHIYLSPGGHENVRNDTVGPRSGSPGLLSDDKSYNFGKNCSLLLRFNYEDYCKLIVSNSTILMPVATTGFHPGFIALIVITILLLMTTSAVVLILWRRREIQAWVFVKTGVRVLDKKAKLDKEDAGCKVFDAFISHSSIDAGFVAETLAPALEHGNRKYRLCIHYRDFPVGRNITDTICRAIENSSRTILLLSVHFLNSEWCRFEFQTAHHHILRQGNHRLIIILLEDIPEDLLDPDLKVQMKSNTYLKYGDPWFWEKLYFAMPSIKDRLGDNETQRLDVLRGMRILAGDDEAADQAANVKNQENEIRPEVRNLELEFFNIFQSNETRHLQDHENRTEEMNSNCHWKPAENHVIMTLQNMDPRFADDDVDAVVNDLTVELGDKDRVEENIDCLVDTLTSIRADDVFCPDRTYLPQVSDFLNDQNYVVDINTSNFEENNPVSAINSRLPLKNDMSNEITDETNIDRRNMGAIRTSSMKDEVKGDDNDNIEENDSECRDNLACEVGDEDETCVFIIDDGRVQPDSGMSDKVEESLV